MEGKSQTSGYGEIGTRTELKILGYYYHESSNLSIRIAELKGLRCNKTLFVWIHELQIDNYRAYVLRKPDCGEEPAFTCQHDKQDFLLN